MIPAEARERTSSSARSVGAVGVVDGRVANNKAGLDSAREAAVVRNDWDRSPERIMLPPGIDSASECAAAGATEVCAREHGRKEGGVGHVCLFASHALLGVDVCVLHN